MSLPEILQTLERKLYTPVLVDIPSEKIVLANGAYTAEDVVSENITTALGAKPWLFRNAAKRNGGGGYITKGLITAQTTNIASWFALFLFNAMPTSELGDAVPNTAPILADRDIYLGRLDFPACTDLGTGMSEILITSSTVGSLPLAFVCGEASRDLQGVLVIRNALDLADTTILRITLTVEQY